MGAATARPRQGDPRAGRQPRTDSPRCVDGHCGSACGYTSERKNCGREHVREFSQFYEDRRC
jgi:hypothetical protein